MKIKILSKLWIGLVLLLTVFLVLAGCENTNGTINQDYIIHIKNNEKVMVDSIYVEVIVDGDILYYQLAEEDFQYVNEPANDSGVVSTTLITAVKVPDNRFGIMQIKYTCFSMGIPILLVQSEIDDNSTVVEKNMQKDSTLIAVMDDYFTMIHSNAVVDSLTLDSLFIHYILTEDSTTRFQLINAYLHKENIDTLLFISLLNDSLVGQGSSVVDSTFLISVGVDALLIAEISNGMISNQVDPQGLSSSSIANVSSQSTSNEERFIFSGTVTAHSESVAQVSIELMGDSIASSIITQAVFDAAYSSYSGYIDLPVIGTNYSVTIKVFDTNGNLTGLQTKQFSTLTFDIKITPFDPWNAKPTVVFDSLSATAVALNDSLYFSWHGVDDVGAITEFLFKEVRDQKWISMELDSTIGIRNPAERGEYQYIVQAIDSDANSVTDKITVSVVNRLPVIQKDSFAVSEKAVVNTEIGTVTFKDLDNDPVIFSIVGGNTNNVFKIDSLTGDVLTSGVIDFEGVPVYDLTIQVDDGRSTSTGVIRVSVINENDAPYFVTSNPLSITTNEDVGVINSIIAFDQDGTTITWSVIDNNKNATVTGIENVEGTWEFTYTPNEQYSGNDTIQVVISDGLYSDTIQVLISVVMVNDITEYSGVFTIAGTDSVGNVLTATTGSCSDVDDSVTHFQTWFIDDDAQGYNGSPIRLDSLYTIQIEDLGKYIYAIDSCVGSTEAIQQSPYTALVVKKTFIDSRDNQVYDFVEIGSQTWMAENLNYSGNDDANARTFTEGYCYSSWVPADTVTCNTYGRLYDWATAMSLDSVVNTIKIDTSDVLYNGICPESWHLPNDSEWSKLYSFIDSVKTSATLSQSIKSTSGWSQNKNGDDEFGLTILPGGYYSGSYTNIEYAGLFWSATEFSIGNAMSRFIHYTSEIAIGLDDTKSNRFSVRCVRDF